MKRWLGALSLVVVGLLLAACQNEPPPPDRGGDVIVQQSVNIFGPTGSSSASPAPPGNCVALHLGCDNMFAPGGASQPGCGPALSDYTAPAGTSGRLDATPVDAQGQKINGLSVAAWIPVGACTLEGILFGPDGFNPTIHMGAGLCTVSVSVNGCPPAQRKFIGQ